MYVPDDVNTEVPAELSQLNRALADVLTSLADRASTRSADAAAVKAIESVTEGVASALDRPVTCAEAAMPPLLRVAADLLDARVSHAIDSDRLTADLRVAVVDLNHGLDVEAGFEGLDFLETSLALLAVLRDPKVLSAKTAAKLVDVLRWGARAVEVARERDVSAHRMQGSPVVVSRPGIGPVPLAY